MSTRSPISKSSGFTLVEVLVAAAVFGLFSAALLATWTSLGTSALNTTSYAQRQNDQMRTLDYLKRDIRRATTVAIYNNSTLVSGVNNWGNTLELTMQKYYADSRQEDDAIGTRTTTAPTLTGGVITYGTPFTVRYYVSNGAIIRSEGGVLRTVGDAAGGFTLSFCTDTTGLIHSRINYSQRMRSGANRMLTRQVDMLCGQRAQL